MEYKCDQLIFDSPFSFVTILKMELLAKVNEHIQLHLYAVIHPDDASDMIMQNYEDNVIKVSLSEGQMFFTGIISEMTIQKKDGLFIMCLSCVSASFLLDVQPRCSSFQDTSESYEKLLKELYKREAAADIMISKKAEIPVQTPVFQYQETAWAFTLRMAGRLSAYVIADCNSSCPRVKLGTTDSVDHELTEQEYTSGYHQANGYYYCFQSLRQFSLGDSIRLRGYRFFIIEKRTIFTRGELINTYMLGTESGYAVKPYTLPLTGLRLKGKVIDTQGEKLKLHLDIDASQDSAKAFWFDFVPQSGNVMYCMPQIGERVMLRFCTNQETSAVVEECWRENGRGCSEPGDYHNRYFTSEFTKRLAMLPESLDFESNGNQLKVTDRAGIRLTSGYNTEIVAEQGVYITSGKRVRTETPKHIYMTKPGTQSVVDFSGNEVNIESQKTNITTNPESMLKSSKDYPPFYPEPAVAINRHLALTVLAFAPAGQGRGEP